MWDSRKIGFSPKFKKVKWCCDPDDNKLIERPIYYLFSLLCIKNIWLKTSIVAWRHKNSGTQTDLGT